MTDDNDKRFLMNHFKKTKEERMKGLSYKQQFDIEHTKKLCNQVFEKSDRLRTIFKSMEDLGCPINANKHISIEYCPKNCKVVGFFFQPTNQVIICQEKFDKLSSDASKEKNIEHITSHELIHAFDNCRTNFDNDDPAHVMCSEIRASSLSGECTFQLHPIKAMLSFLESYHKKCVLNHALMSFQYCFKDWSDRDANNLADKLFPMCYNDLEPFDRIPLSREECGLSYKAYLSRNRYEID